VDVLPRSTERRISSTDEGSMKYAMAYLKRGRIWFCGSVDLDPRKP
jgi:hypothetical protein